MDWLFTLASTGPYDNPGFLAAEQLLPATWVIGVVPWLQRRPFLYWASTAAIVVMLVVWVANHGATLGWVHIQLLSVRLLLTALVLGATATRAYYLTKRERTNPTGD